MTVQPTAPPADLAGVASRVDQTAILRALNLNGSDPKAQAVVLVCHRYGLDPFLKHVVLVDGNVYITRDGLLHVAHSSGRFDGLEVDEARRDPETGEWRSRASVFRKDMGRPFTFSGRYAHGKKNAPEMAEKVAVARALRHAFDVAIATEDERQAGETGTAPTVAEAGQRLRAAAQPAAQPAPRVVDQTGQVADRADEESVAADTRLADLLREAEAATTEDRLLEVWAEAEDLEVLDAPLVTVPDTEATTLRHVIGVLVAELRARTAGDRLVALGDELNGATDSGE